ncbi:hypothetical protein BB561_003745 [Smittium simulii]|uniref:Cytochrome P450 n=1 Tax=Smittium simulii TaxID=133385 RepID=A0A2T9YJR9_9FUNG|nr:hypothetical protein BB561_003745 [Smittium simulii]
MRYTKNSPIIDKKIYKIKDSRDISVLGKAFLVEYYSISELITNVPKSHIIISTTFASHLRYKYSIIIMRRYLSLFVSSFRLNVYINRVQGIIESGIHKYVGIDGTRINKKQYQIDDDYKSPVLLSCIQNLIKSDQNYSIKDFIFEKINTKAIGLISSYQSDKNTLISYLKYTFAQSKSRSSKSSVKVLHFILNNSEMFETNNFEVLAESLIKTIVISLSLLTYKLNDTICWILNNVHIIDRLYFEQMTIIQNYGSDITPAIINKMVLLDIVIKEVTRLTQVISFTTRCLNKSVTLSNGVTLLEDSIISLNGASVHRQVELPNVNLNLHTNPQGENLDGFTDVSPENLAWSAGPHMCLAKDFAANFMKQYLAILIREYYFEPLFSRSASKHTSTLNFDRTFPKYGTIFTKRK